MYLITAQHLGWMTEAWERLLMIKTIYSPDIRLLYMPQCAMLIRGGSGLLVSCEHYVSCYSLGWQLTRVFNVKVVNSLG